MPVTVTIPVTADYREVTLALGEADYLTSICLSPDYIFGVTDEAPAKLVRISRSDFSQRSVLTFANDDEHKNGADVMHVGAAVGGGIYVMFRNGPPNTLMISKVDFTTTPMTYTDWWREEDYAAGYGTMTTDDVYVYALVGPFPNAYIARMKLSDQTAVITQIPGVTFGRNLRISGSPAKLYAVGQTDPPDDGLMWVRRLRFDTDTLVVEQSATISGGNTTVIPNNIGVELQPKDYIWVGSRDFTGTLKRIQKSNLSNVTTVATAITPSTSSGCRAMEDDNPYVWALFDNGKAVRINTDLPSLEQRTYALSGGFHYRMVSGDPYLFGSFYSAPTKIARYRIPSPPTETTPPSVGMTRPTNGGVVSAGIDRRFPFQAFAIDNVGMSRVEFYDNGVLFGSVSASTPTQQFFDLNFNIDSMINGLHQFRAKAFDTSGNSASSAIVTATVSGSANPAGVLQWLRNSSGGTAEPNGVAADSNSNVYLVGESSGANFGNGSIGVVRNMFVAKYNVSGTLQWIKQAGEFSADVSTGVAVDHSDNVIVVGYFASPTMDLTEFGGLVLTRNSSAGDMFVLKLNSSGGLIWHKQFNGTIQTFPSGVAVASNNDVIFATQFQQNTTFDSFPVSTSGSAGFAVVRLSASNGLTTWAEEYGGSAYNLPRGVAVDADDDVLVTGMFIGTTNLGNGNVSASGTQNAFIAKYSGVNGSHMWSKVAGDTSINSGYGILADHETNWVYVTGGCAGSIDFGTSIAGGIFLVAFNPTGDHQWSRGTDSNSATGTSLALSSIDGGLRQLVLAGNTAASTFFMEAMTLGTGATLPTTRWQKTAVNVTTAFSGARSLAYDADDNVLVCGFVRGSITIDGVPTSGASAAPSLFTIQFNE